MMKTLINYLHDYNASRELLNARFDLSQDRSNLNVNETVDLIYGEKWNRFFWIKQIKWEILQLLKEVKKLTPIIILEIGTASGGSLFLFSQVAHKNAEIISLDLPGGKFGGGYPKYKEKFYKSFASKNQKIHLIRADSHSEESLLKIKDYLRGRSIDFLFIDGDHTYEGVKKDYDQYSPLVKKGGLIAFHDIAKHPPEWDCRVRDFWNQIKTQFKHKEFIEKENQGWAGIGLLYNE